jgi:hypothetical protein
MQATRGGVGVAECAHQPLKTLLAPACPPLHFRAALHRQRGIQCRQALGDSVHVPLTGQTNERPSAVRANSRPCGRRSWRDQAAYPRSIPQAMRPTTTNIAGFTNQETAKAAETTARVAPRADASRCARQTSLLPPWTTAAGAVPASPDPQTPRPQAQTPDVENLKTAAAARAPACAPGDVVDAVGVACERLQAAGPLR